jgi:hypothetical protein
VSLRLWGGLAAELIYDILKPWHRSKETAMATKKTAKVCEVKLPEGSRTKLGEHGTTTRYNQMVRLGVPACQDCKTANTLRDLAYRARRKATKK